MLNMSIDKKPVVIPAAVHDSIVNLRAAFYQMNEAFNDDFLMEWLSAKYPFGYSFTELVDDVAEWCDDMLKGTVRGD
jgi:hypothetical protein